MATSEIVGGIISASQLGGRSGNTSPLGLAAGSVDYGTVAGGTTTLSEAQYICPFLRLGGTASGTVNLIFPAVNGAFWLIDNSGSAVAKCYVSSGTVTIASLKQATIAVSNGEIQCFGRP